MSRRSLDSSQVVVAATGLAKAYGGRRVLDQVDLRIAHGEIFALLGPNGAGKTTLIEILEGHRLRDAGEVDVLGVDPAIGGRDWRDRIGLVAQEHLVEPMFTARELLELQQRIFSRGRDPGELMEMFGLASIASTRLARLSVGQRRQVELALAMTGRPEILFLDEPTAGLDPEAREALWGFLRAQRAAGTSILLTTHSLEETDNLADRAAILASGRILFDGDLADARTLLGLKSRISFRASQASMVQQLATITGASIERKGGDSWLLACEDPIPILARLTDCSMKQQLEVRDLEVRPASFSDLYHHLVGDSRA